MLRRKPTRIELKLDDLEEYEAVKKEREAQKKVPTTPQLDSPIASSEMTEKSKRDMIHERIGFNPQPAPQPSMRPLH